MAVNSMKKVLIFIDWFIPGYKAGGPVQSVANLVYALHREYSFFIYTSNCDHGETTTYKDLPANTWVPLSGTSAQVFYADKAGMSYRSMQQQIEALNADIIYLNSMFSTRFVLQPLIIRKVVGSKAKWVLSPRGCLYESALQKKRWRKTAFLRVVRALQIFRDVTFQSTNMREAEAVQLHIPEVEVQVVEDFMQTLQQPVVYCSKQSGRLRLLYIARIVPIKNLLFVLQLLKDIRSIIDMSIIGPVEDPAYFRECEQLIEQLPANVQVQVIGPVPNHKLYDYFIDHHLYILPSTGENFGHSIFESLLAGRPVLISDQTPWSTLSENNAGWAVPLDRPDVFLAHIESLAAQDQESFNHLADDSWQFAHSFIQTTAIRDQYRALFSR